MVVLPRFVVDELNVADGPIPDEEAGLRPLAASGL
jgi:hypothetical protein